MAGPDDAERDAIIRARLATAPGVALRATLGLRLLDHGGGHARVACDVTDTVANAAGTLHGGVIATLVDEAGTVAIMSADAEVRAGVTTDLNVTYLRPATAGATVVGEARTLRAGRTLAFVEVDVRDAAGALVAQGRMTKLLPSRRGQP